MSNRSIERVQSVSCAPALAGGATLCGALIGVAAYGLVAAARELYRLYTSENVYSNPEAMMSVAALRHSRSLAQEKVASLAAGRTIAPVDTIKLTALASLASTPYAVESAAIQSQLQALRQAATVADANSASRALIAAVEASHGEVMMRSLSLAWQRAAVNIGFTNFHVPPAPRGALRLVAEDARGRAIVSEIVTDEVGNVSLESEVVGVSDNSCVAILDAFDEALKRQGVRTGLPKRRKMTGGIAETRAALDFLRSKPQRVPQRIRTEQQQDRRRQRLNVNRPAGRIQRRSGR